MHHSPTYHFAELIDPDTFAWSFSDLQVATLRIQQIPDNFFVDFQERTLDRVLRARGVVSNVLKDVRTRARNNTYRSVVSIDNRWII